MTTYFYKQKGRKEGGTMKDTGTALMEIPLCPRHQSPMHYRPAETPEQSFCGAWYDCDEPGCTCSALIMSAELRGIYRAHKTKFGPNAAQS